MNVSRAAGEEGAPPFSTRVPALLFLALIFFLNFTSRIVFAPLLPVISSELGLDYLDSGSFFLAISIGYFVAILFSGHVSARITHHWSIVLSAVLSGLMLMVVASSDSLGTLRLGLVGLGAAAGIYFPSGLATIGGLVPSGYLARGMAVHELAPNVAFVLTPLAAGAVLMVGSWRQGLVSLGVVLLTVGIFYGVRGGRSGACGVLPRFGFIHSLLRLPEFWLVTVMFSMAICSTLGIYALLPLYLVSELGMEKEGANMLVALSRVSSVVMPIAAGWLGDRYGNRKVMGAVLFLGGIMTVPIGFTQGPLLIVFVVLQAMIAVCFFPSAFAVVTTIGTAETKGMAVTVSLPLAFLAGGGILPTVIGGIGDISRLGSGFVVAGVLMIAASFCAARGLWSDGGGCG